VHFKVTKHFTKFKSSEKVIKMKLVFVFSLVILCYFANTGNSQESTMQKVEGSMMEKFGISEKYESEKLIKIIAEMMKNTNKIKKGYLNIAIYSMVADVYVCLFEDFHETFNKIYYENITYDLFCFSTMPIKESDDFVILLLHDLYKGYEKIIRKYFLRIFPNLLTNFFVLLFDTSDITRLDPVFNAISSVGYINTYFFLIDPLYSFKMFRLNLTQRTNKMSQLTPVENKKFLDAKAAFPDFKYPTIYVVHFDTYPLTYQKNGTIYGTDGNVIQEFSKRIGIPYKIANKDTSKVSLNNAIKTLKGLGDICLFTSINFQSNYIVHVMLNEMDGGCFLLPRNILVSNFENLVIPFDDRSMILIAFSIILIIICIKVFSIMKGREMSLSTIIFDVYQLTLSLGITTLHRFSAKEKVMLISFLFMSIILVASYQSIILTFMVMKSTMRSAHSFEELNRTNTKFYSFFRKTLNYENEIPNIRDDLIINYFDLSDSVSNDLPNNFDPNLVYLVSCKYADYFIQSPKNYRGNERIFDKLVFNEFYQRYMVRKNFIYLQEFKFMISAFKESGIYGHWQKNVIPISDANFISDENEEEIYLNFQNLKITFYILLLGIAIAFNVFVIEITIRYLRKWIAGRKDTLTIDNRKCFIRQKEILLPLRQGTKRWNKQINRIIQVRPRKN